METQYKHAMLYEKPNCKRVLLNACANNTVVEN